MTLSGKVLYAVSNAAANVYIAWGATDGGESTNLWDHVVSAGASGAGAFSHTLTGLASGQPLYFRVFAVNAEGLVSSHVSTPFDTESLLGSVRATVLMVK